jgi:transcriptional regulator with XRE-family HTH domain
VPARLEGRQLARDAARGLGKAVRECRTRRRWSQRVLGQKVGLTSQRIGQIERGDESAGLEIWFALSETLGTPLKVEFKRDALLDVVDAGHLQLQELALSLGRLTGRARGFEIPTKPADPSHSIDVFLRDDALRILFINECWNAFGNINASVRSTRRKIVEAEQLAIAIGGDAGPYRVAAVWIVRDTRVNRALIARYPEVFANAFVGSSSAWVASLTTATVVPPTDLGLVWADVNATRVFAWRRR